MSIGSKRTVNIKIPEGTSWLGVTLQSEKPCVLACVSGPAALAGARNGDRLVSINGESVGDWPQSNVAQMLWSQRGTITLQLATGNMSSAVEIAHSDNPVQHEALAALTAVLRIKASYSLPMEGYVRFIRSFDMSVNVLRCDRSLLLLQKKLSHWARRPVDRASPICMLRILDRTHELAIVTVSCGGYESVENNLCCVALKDIILHGTLLRSPNVWALITRGSKRRIGIMLLRHSDYSELPKRVPLSDLSCNSDNENDYVKSNAMYPLVLLPNLRKDNLDIDDEYRDKFARMPEASGVVKKSRPKLRKEFSRSHEHLSFIGNEMDGDDKYNGLTNDEFPAELIDRFKTGRKHQRQLSHDDYQWSAAADNAFHSSSLAELSNQNARISTVAGAAEDDDSFAPLVSDPSVRRWATSLKDLLRDSVGKHAFMRFLQSEYSEENLKFWIACDDYRKITDGFLRQQSANDIWEKFLNPLGDNLINVDNKSKDDVFGGLSDSTQSLFESIQEQIYKLMKYDSYQRFLKSDVYKDCLYTQNIHLLDNGIDDLQSGEDKASGETASRRRFTNAPWVRVLAASRWKKYTSKRSITMPSKESLPPTYPFFCLLIEGTLSVRVVLADDNSMMKTVREVVAPILKRRGLTWYRTVLTDEKTDTVVSFTETALRCAGMRLLVTEQCMFGLSTLLPDNTFEAPVVMVKAEQTCTIREALVPLLREFSGQEKSQIIAADFRPSRIDPDRFVSEINNRLILIDRSQAKPSDIVVADEDFMSAIDEDELKIVFELHGNITVLRSSQQHQNVNSIIQPSSHTVSQPLDGQRDGTLLGQRDGTDVVVGAAASSSSSAGSSPPAEFRRPRGVYYSSLAKTVKMLPNASDLHEDPPDRFIFSLDSLSLAHSSLSDSSCPAGNPSTRHRRLPDQMERSVEHHPASNGYSRNAILSQQDEAECRAPASRPGRSLALPTILPRKRQPYVE